MGIEPFSLPFCQAAVDDLQARLLRTRWLDEIPGSAWEYGFGQAFLRDLCEFWRTQFDWQAQLRKLSDLPHFWYPSKDGGVHFIHVRGKGPAPMPLIFTHGWPGSFLEFLPILPLLTDAFDVVIPSLPGFGFSTKPARPGMNAFRIADLWAALMRELGYERFAAQGGDLGAGVSTALGLRHPDRIIGIHLNFLPGSFQPYVAPGEELRPEEKSFLEGVVRWADESGAYSHLQRTRPQTAAYGLNDSPAALAAWIVEKFREWSDCEGDVYRRFSREELLTNVTLYWMTETIYSSFRLYFENRKAPLRFGAKDFVAVPCAFARFPKEISAPPRCWVERGFNIRRWTEMPGGGHFAAAEEPQLLAEDLRAFFRDLRA